MKLDGKTTVEYGRVAVLHQVAKRINLVKVINKCAPKKGDLSVGELVEVSAINRIVDPLAKTNIPQWYETTYLPELLGFELPLSSGYQTLTRCYDVLTEDVQMDIEIELAPIVKRVYHLTDDTYLYDLTNTFVEGIGEAEILQFGHSKENRSGNKLVNYGMVVTQEDAIPLFHRAFPGNKNDCRTVKSTMDLFHSRLGLQGCLVMDRGLVSAENIKDIVDDRHLDLVAGLRSNKKLKGQVVDIPMDKYGPTFLLKKETVRAYEFPHVIGDKERRCILYHSEDKAKRDAKAREKNLKDVTEEMKKFEKKAQRKGRGRKSKTNALIKKIEDLLQKKGMKDIVQYRFVGGRGGRSLKWCIDDDAIKTEECLDGKYILITTLNKKPKDILGIYRSRNGIERAFRMTKECIHIRPIFNRKDEHIRAHLFICFIAYLLLSLVEKELKGTDAQMTGMKAMRELKSETVQVDRKLRQRGGKKVLKALRLKKPDR